MIRFSLMLILVFCCHWQMCYVSSDMVNVNTDDSEENASNAPFVPTKEWQRVKKGQAIPAGIHSRINLKTGVVEAKLLDDDKDENTALSSVSKEESLSGDIKIPAPSEEKFSKDRLQEMLSKLSEAHSEATDLSIENDEDTKKNFRSYEEIKKEFEELKMSIKTDSELIAELWERFKSAEQPEAVVHTLMDLEYLLHQTDNAINFAQAGGFSAIVMPAINSSNMDVVVTALRLLGSASQSNPKVQIAALEAGAVEKVLRLVKNPEVSSSALHALSCIIRGFPLAQKNFVKYGGLAILASLYDESDRMSSRAGGDVNKRWKAKVRAVSLLHDLMLELQHSEGEARNQYMHVGLQEHIISNDWCKLFPSLLTVVDDHDAVEKGAEAMLSYWDICRMQFLQASPEVFQAEERYNELSRLEVEEASEESGVIDDSMVLQSEYFSSVANLITSLGERLRSLREEL